jgi:hypothetical protein
VNNREKTIDELPRKDDVSIYMQMLLSFTYESNSIHLLLFRKSGREREREREKIRDECNHKFFRDETKGEQVEDEQANEKYTTMSQRKLLFIFRIIFIWFNTVNNTAIDWIDNLIDTCFTEKAFVTCHEMHVHTRSRFIDNK